MPHIKLRPELFGITSLLDFRKKTAAPLCALTDLLLRGKSTLSESERELIAAYVSYLNQCSFCFSAHSTAACLLPGGDLSFIEQMKENIGAMDVSEKMLALLNIAGKVQQSGKNVHQSDIDEVKSRGATDLEIHDTVLIAALFCLYNRYVDGLATATPKDPAFYQALGERITNRGYAMPQDGYRALQVADKSQEKILNRHFIILQLRTMPYINTPDSTPGIRGLMNFRPDAAIALNQLAQVLLVEDASLSRSDREMIASFVSHQNNCMFCMKTHGAIAAHLPGCNTQIMHSVWNDFRSAPITDKLKSLLNIADKVSVSGRTVTETDISHARDLGANDMDIHDTVLIAATFCMFNRYVDGLGATTPDDPALYEMIGQQRAAEGYLTKSILIKD